MIGLFRAALGLALDKEHNENILNAEAERLMRAATAVSRAVWRMSAMSWDVLALDLPPGIETIDEIPKDWSPAPLGKRADIIAKICALYPEASFGGDPSWGNLRLPGVGIEFNLGGNEDVKCLGMHVRGGDRAPHVVAYILNTLGMRAVTTSESGLFDCDPETESKAFDSWRGYAAHVSSHINGSS
jgi:hypothetical protein